MTGGSKPTSAHQEQQSSTESIPPSGQLYLKSIYNCCEYSWRLPGKV